MIAVESPICDCCGLPFESRQGTDHRCGGCIENPKYFRIARAPLVYDQILMRLIQRFKYKGKLQLARPLAELALTACRLFWDRGLIDMIIPVPLHISRMRTRGFNQSYLLVRNWNQMAAPGGELSGGYRIEPDLLVRSRATAPQTSLGRKQRSDNIKKAFALTDRNEVAGKRILLIDDVYTTGATVNECARELLNGGAGQVDVLTLARAV